MAVGLIVDFDGGTIEQYDQMNEKMEIGDKAPPGCHFHWSTKTDNGFRVVDVWDDRATFDAFFQEKVGPHAGEVGIPEPQIEEFEVYKELTP